MSFVVKRFPAWSNHIESLSTSVKDGAPGQSGLLPPRDQPPPAIIRRAVDQAVDAQPRAVLLGPVGAQRRLAGKGVHPGVPRPRIVARRRIGE